MIKLFFYLIEKYLLNKKIVVCIDRDNEAGDNAESLFNVLNKEQSLHAIFMIKDDNLDWIRLSKQKNVVKLNSLTAKIYLMCCDCIVSSSADYYIRRYAEKKPFVFLQHGVVKDDMSFFLIQKNGSTISSVQQKLSTRHFSLINGVTQ